MTIDDFYKGIKSLGLPIAYRSFSENEVPNAPYFVYYEGNPDVLFADGRTYCLFGNTVLELYCDKKDCELEKEVEAWLDENELAFKKDEFYIETEGYIEIVYYIGL